jgi:hypothetical protein
MHINCYAPLQTGAKNSGVLFSLLLQPFAATIYDRSQANAASERRKRTPQANGISCQKIYFSWSSIQLQAMVALPVGSRDEQDPPGTLRSRGRMTGL